AGGNAHHGALLPPTSFPAPRTHHLALLAVCFPLFRRRKSSGGTVVVARFICTLPHELPVMRYRLCPGAGIKASEVGFGPRTLSTGWCGEKTDDEAVALLRAAHSQFGINFFDTADTYGNGRGERQL